MTRTLALSALLSTLLVGPTYAADPVSKTVADLYKEKADAQRQGGHTPRQSRQGQ